MTLEMETLKKIKFLTTTGETKEHSGAEEVVGLIEKGNKMGEALQGLSPIVYHMQFAAFNDLISRWAYAHDEKKVLESAEEMIREKVLTKLDISEILTSAICILEG